MASEDEAMPVPDATPRAGILPEDWLNEPVDVQQVEEDFAEEGMPDFWLEAWRTLLERRNPGDELWYYLGQECNSEGDSGEWQEGYALVRNGAIIDFLGRPP